MDVAILAHEGFPDRAKTATGILRYGDQNVRAVLDRAHAGKRVGDLVSGVADAPIVAGIEEVPGIDAGEIDALVIGIAPIGGGFEESWRPDVRGALERGCDVLSGLHYFLSEDEEFAALAAERGCELIDLREPPEDLSVSQGIASEVDAQVVLTVGTDCSVGKMTVSYELVEAAREAGIDAAVIPTGQTGIAIEGWGNPIDRVVSDFAAGAVEEMIVERGEAHDLLVVEGQGSITHPAYSAVTCGILHGAMADSLVLCHAAGRERVHGYEDYELPPIRTYRLLYEDIAAPVRETEVVAGALNTSHLDEEPARKALDEYAEALDAPASDPIRFGSELILEAIR
jgi:uncharacterized NAD-dependent epimerase/dehydratase family protein